MSISVLWKRIKQCQQDRAKYAQPLYTIFYRETSRRYGCGSTTNEYGYWVEAKWTGRTVFTNQKLYECVINGENRWLPEGEVRLPKYDTNSNKGG